MLTSVKRPFWLMPAAIRNNSVQSTSNQLTIIEKKNKKKQKKKKKKKKKNKQKKEKEKKKKQTYK